MNPIHMFYLNMFEFYLRSWNSIHISGVVYKSFLVISKKVGGKTICIGVALNWMEDLDGGK